MPPAAQLEFTTSIEEPYDSVADVGGIEVEAVDAGDVSNVLTRIIVLPREAAEENSSIAAGKRYSLEHGSSQFEYFEEDSANKCLADSFDSLDEIDGRKVATNTTQRDTVVSYSISTGLAEPLSPSAVNSHDIGHLGEAEANKYLDVLEEHLEATEPELVSFTAMEENPDDPYPTKEGDQIDKFMETLLDSPCCECTQAATRPLKSALKTPRWSFGGATRGERGGTTAPLERDRSVQFKNVDIREFNMTLGDHPSATSGPPVMLDWGAQPSPNVVGLESYEKARQPRRNRRQLRLTLQERHNILVKEQGFSFEEVKGAWQEALELRKQRKETLARGHALTKWDEVWESTCRKFNRVVDI